MSTGGDGGRKIRESVRIKTNDPNRPWLQVAVTGMVEKFADIRPERVLLSGLSDQSLFVEVEIIPKKDFPFTIGQIKAEKGSFIKYELVQRCSDVNDRCILRVENTLRKKGRYVDALYVGTNSKLRPTIPIYITGMIK